MENSPLNFIVDLARQTGELLCSYFQNNSAKARLKADRSIVTEADLAADRLISETLTARFPGDALISEELRPAPGVTGEQNVWVIDPLDGTTNFSLGLHYWGVLIARLISGEPDLAVMYFPWLNELYTAVKGRGAFLNGDPIHVQPPDPDRPSAFFSCCARTHRRYNVRVPYKPRILGSAAFTFCSVGRGVALVGFEATPKLWDIAGSWLLVHEAGGVIAAHGGPEPFPLRPGIDFSHQSYPCLAAPSAELWETTAHQITPR